MEWNQELFVAFMLAMTGGVLFIQLQLHQITKKLKVEDDRRNAGEEEPGDGFPDAEDDA